MYEINTVCWKMSSGKQKWPFKSIRSRLEQRERRSPLSLSPSDMETVTFFLDGHSELSSNLFPSLKPQQFSLLCDFSVAEICCWPTFKPYVQSPLLSKRHFILALRTFIF